MGVLVYMLILALFLLFFPGSQGKVLATLSSLGADRHQQRKQVMLHSFGILAPGTVVGLIAGAALWQTVCRMMMRSVDVVLELELSIPVLLMIALGSFALAMFLSTILSILMTRRNSLMNRR